MHVKSYEAVMMQFPEYRILKYLLIYIPPVLIVLGTFGNVVSFVVLRRRAMSKVSSYLYLASLAVADSLVLYIGLLRLWLGELTGVDFHDSSEWLCKVTVFLGYLASDLSVWLIIAVTVERYIVVCFPLRASTMCNTNRAKCVIGFIVFLICSMNLHFFWTVGVVERTVDSENITKCEASPDFDHLVEDVWPWVDACVYSFLPFVIILVFNVLIITEVMEARAHRLNLQNMPDYHYHQQKQPQQQQQQQNYHHRRSTSGAVAVACRRSCSAGEGTKLTVMLLTVSFTFLLTTLPMNISLIVTAFWEQQNHGLRQVAQLKLANTVAELLMYANHSINFYLYCATGQKFRQQIAHLMCCRSGASSSWNSTHTEHTPLNSLHGNKNSNPHLLLASVPDDTSSNENDMILLRTKV